jgi:DNA-binding transcriptional ArsR family regulator
MTDIFKAIADPKARLVLESLAKQPASTAAKAVTATKLTSAQVTTILTSLSEAKLVKGTGSGASRKYSLNAKGFSPIVSWLAKVAEAQAVSSLEKEVLVLGEKLGRGIADGSVWVAKKVKENLGVDSKKVAKDIGRKAANAKRDVQKEVKAVKKEAKAVVTKVKKSVKR